MTMPILKPLKIACPQAEITMLVPSSAAPLLEQHPYCNKVIAWNAPWFYPVSQIGNLSYQQMRMQLRKEKYDLIIEARGDIRDITVLTFAVRAKYRLSYGYGGGEYLLTHTAPYPEIIHKVDGHLNLIRHIGVPVLPDDKTMKVYLANNEIRVAKETLSKMGIPENSVIIGIQPGGRKALKSWSPDKYGALAKWLSTEYNAQIVVTGTAEESALLEQMQQSTGVPLYLLAGKTTIRELAAILSVCHLFICNDSAPMHLAAAVNTPTLAIFGPSKSLETAPYGDIHQVVELDYPCRWTCDEDQCYYKNYQECLTALPVELVTEKARMMLDGLGIRPSGRQG